MRKVLFNQPPPQKLQYSKRGEVLDENEFDRVTFEKNCEVGAEKGLTYALLLVSLLINEKFK